MLAALAVELTPEAIPFPSLEEVDSTADATADFTFSKALLEAVTEEEAVATARRVSDAVKLAPAVSVDSSLATEPAALVEIAVSAGTALTSPDATAEDAGLVAETSASLNVRNSSKEIVGQRMNNHIRVAATILVLGQSVCRQACKQRSKNERILEPHSVWYYFYFGGLIDCKRLVAVLFV